MRKKNFWLIFLLLIGTLFFVKSVFALCEEDQININTALEEDLTKIIHVGPARASQIAELRPFNSVDELTKVNGLGESRLADIKIQGLACVETENPENNSKNGIEDNKKNNSKENKIMGNTTSNEKDLVQNTGNEKNLVSDTDSEKKINTIQLNSPNQESGEGKDINKANKFYLGENFPLFVFAAFCVLIAGLFMARRVNRKMKNEFR